MEGKGWGGEGKEVSGWGGEGLGSLGKSLETGGVSEGRG